MKEKISAVYKIVNEVTGDFYIGSSKNVKNRWADHKKPSNWKRYPNIHLYQDLHKYGVENFRFQILTPVMPEYLKQVEQELIETLKPTYNNYNAKGCNVEKHKEADRKGHKKYRQTEKGKESNRKGCNKYCNRLCSYNGETLTLRALGLRFRRNSVKNPFVEAKKYLKETK